MTQATTLRLQRMVQVGVVVVGLLLGLRAYRALILADMPLHADEAGHALPAARMTLALRQGDTSRFVAASLQEVVWPFMHPWLLTASFLAFGISARVARACSLLTFGAGLCLLPPLARRLSSHDPARAGVAPPPLGWLSVAMAISAAPWVLVCTVMSEPLGMFLTLLVLLVAAEARTRDTLGWHALAGSIAALAFFTKYSHGLPLMAALPLAAAWPSPRSRIPQVLATLAGALTPVLAWALVILWPNPQRGSEILGALANRDEGLRGFSDFLFYPKTVLNQVGAPAGLAVLLLLAVTAFRRETARLPALLLAAGTLVLLTSHPNKQERYLFPALPVMLVMAETEAARLLGRRRWLPALWSALTAALLVAGNPLARVDEQAQGASDLRGARSIVSYVADNVAYGEPVLFLGTAGLLPHLALTWELIEREQREPEVDLLPFPGSSGWDPRYRAGYPPEPRSDYDVSLLQALATGRYRCLVTLRLGEHSPFRPAWLAKWDAWGQNYVEAADRRAAEGGYLLTSARSFPEDDAVVRIFARSAARPTRARGSE